MSGSVKLSPRQFRRFLLCGLACLAAVVAPGLARAQAAPLETGLSRFEWPESGLVWKVPVHPQRFFDATGRRAGAFGRQTGQFEAWIYPLKLLHGFRLEFQQEGMVEPVRGEAFLEQIETRPESTTFVYVHPNFTVRETIWVPLYEPAIVVFFDVDSDKPLTITVKFVPDFKPMWPASLGGQHSFWLEEEKAFGLTDGTGRPTALIGSPAVGAFTEFMDHQLIGGEMVLKLAVKPRQTQTGLFPLVMALSMEGEEEARAAYRSVLERARALYEERVQYHRDFLARTLHIETPEADLNRALEWAKVALDAGWVCHPRYGCGLVAGYGPSGDGERPGFAWWFGGDALLATWALEDYGDLDGALQALRFLKARQRPDGKMMHEMTQSVDLVDWFGGYGFAYYHADTTPLYLYALGQYWHRTGDKKFLEEFWESAKKAYEYCLSTVTPEDGLMDNTKAGLAAVEVGPLRGKVVKDIYLEGFWVAGLDALADMAEAMDDRTLVHKVRETFSHAINSLRDQWWNEEGRYFTFGLTAAGERADQLGNWSAVLLALSHLDPGLAREATVALARPELATDWGVRFLANTDPLYDPVSYNNGSVWPFMSGFVAWAQYKNKQPLAGFATWSSIARLTGAMAAGAVPELMNGDRFRPGERAVPHQLFSSWAVLIPAVRGLLGLEVDRWLPQPTLSFMPHLPAHWPFLRFARYPTGSGSLSGEVRQERNRLFIRLEYESSQPLDVVLAPALPRGAEVRRVQVNGKSAEFTFWDVPSVTYVSFNFALQRKAEVVIEYEGGVGIVPVAPRPEPGERSAALKILRVRSEGREVPNLIELTLAGLGGRTYSLDLITTVPGLTAEGAQVQKTSDGYRLEISFEGSGYVTRTVRVRF